MPVCARVCSVLTQSLLRLAPINKERQLNDDSMNQQHFVTGGLIFSTKCNEDNPLVSDLPEPSHISPSHIFTPFLSVSFFNFPSQL